MYGKHHHIKRPAIERNHGHLTLASGAESAMTCLLVFVINERCSSRLTWPFGFEATNDQPPRRS
jgi:hypothetical protein